MKLSVLHHTQCLAFANTKLAFFVEVGCRKLHQTHYLFTIMLPRNLMLIWKYQCIYLKTSVEILYFYCFCTAAAFFLSQSALLKIFDMLDLSIHVCPSQGFLIKYHAKCLLYENKGYVVVQPLSTMPYSSCSFHLTLVKSSPLLIC